MTAPPAFMKSRRFGRNDPSNSFILFIASLPGGVPLPPIRTRRWSLTEERFFLAVRAPPV